MAQVYANKYCFAHIPKCGGTWVRKVMEYMKLEITGDFGGNHAPAPEGHPEWTTFTFVRHPATWLASWWAHEMRHGWPDDGPLPESWTGKTPYERMVEVMGQYKSDDFNQFACALEAERPGYVSRFFKTFTANCDVIGKQENLQRDLALIVGRGTDFGPYNVTPDEYRAIITPATHNFIEMHEPMEWFGY